MIKRTREKIVAVILYHPNQKYFVLGAGVTTFIFGFAGGAILNLYLIMTGSTVFGNLRKSLDYKSSIFGDGLILPIVNMLAMWFILKNLKFVKEKDIKISIIAGFLITIYFHINQAARGLINWAMPTPWHWNTLGVFHAAYMFAAFSFISLFYIILGKYMLRYKRLPMEALAVTVGGIIFLILLRLDYIAVSFHLPKL